jgi:hypothetical protein
MPQPASIKVQDSSTIVMKNLFINTLSFNNSSLNTVWHVCHKLASVKSRYVLPIMSVRMSAVNSLLSEFKRSFVF